MQKKHLFLLSLFAGYVILVTTSVVMADPVDDILRIWQETIWNWGRRIFWFFGVAAAIVIASSPDHRKKAMYVLGGVVLFYIAPLIIDIVQQAAGRPF